MTDDADVPRYDFGEAPRPDEWLAMDEEKRIAVVREAHERSRSPVGQNPDAHALIHVMVENQLAEGQPSIVAAYDRCRAEGLDRHATVHALASVVTRHMLAMLEQQTPFDQASANRDFAALDPKNFKPKS
jgi:hypothetical protein